MGDIKVNSSEAITCTRQVNLNCSEWHVLNYGSAAAHIIFYDLVRKRGGIADEYGNIILEFNGNQLRCRRWKVNIYGQFAVVGDSLYIVRERNRLIRCDAESSRSVEVNICASESGDLDFEGYYKKIVHLFGDGSCYYNVPGASALTYFYDAKVGKVRTLDVSVVGSYVNNWCTQISENDTRLHLAKGPDETEAVEALLYEDHVAYDPIGFVQDESSCSSLFGAVRDGAIECLDPSYGKIPIKDTLLYKTLSEPASKKEVLRRGEFVKMGTQIDDTAPEWYSGPKGEVFPIWEYDALVFDYCVLLLKRGKSGSATTYCIKLSKPIRFSPKEKLSCYKMRLFGAMRVGDVVSFTFVWSPKGNRKRREGVAVCKFNLSFDGSYCAGEGKVYSCVEFSTFDESSQLQGFPYCYQVEYEKGEPVYRLFKCGADYYDFSVRLRDIKGFVMPAKRDGDCANGYYFVLGALEDGENYVIVDMTRKRVVQLQRAAGMRSMENISNCLIEKCYEIAETLERHTYFCFDGSNYWAFYDNGEIVPVRVHKVEGISTRGYRTLSALENAVDRVTGADPENTWGPEVDED